MGWQDWLPWPSSKRGDDKKDGNILPASFNTSKTGSWEKNLNATDWSHYTSVQTITACTITAATTLLLVRVYKTYIRRIPNVEYLKPGLFRRRSIYGYVTSVGDGDNFRLFHTPGGKWLGWGWMRGRKPEEMKKLRDKTVHVRIAGVDAPEMAHFGRPAQPYGQEALDYLRESILGKYVRAYPYRKDQYERVVCTVYKKRWFFFRSDVGYHMLKNGFATVYEAKYGSEFGGKEESYKAVEAWAKKKQIGMWQKQSLVSKMFGRKDEFESPRDYKTRMAEGEKSDAKKK